MLGNTTPPPRLTHDPRIQSRLNEAELKYEILDDGDFSLSYTLENERTHTAFINSETYEYLGMEIREIYAVGLSSFGPFDARTCNILLHENAVLKVGAWGVESVAEDDTHYAIFRVQISADLPTKELLGVLETVLEIADKMEARLSGRDDF